MTKRSPFRYFKTTPEIIRLAVMLYVRFPEGFSMRAAARRLLLDRCRPALTNLGRRKLRGAWWDLWGKH